MPLFRLHERVSKYYTAIVEAEDPEDAKAMFENDMAMDWDTNDFEDNPVLIAIDEVDEHGEEITCYDIEDGKFVKSDR